MDNKKIEKLMCDVNTFLHDTVKVLEKMQNKAYDEREIDLLKPISKTINLIKDNRIKIVNGLDKLSKLKSNW
jgi:hypothetical protein